jgi:outer membrane protein TolC
VEATLVGIDEERGAAVDALRAGNDHVVVASLELRLPLANRSARGARAAAEAELRALEHLEAELRARVALMVRDASEDGRIAEARVRLLASAVRAAQISLDAEQARFAVGRSTNFEVLRRQEELALARLRRLRAAVDLAKAHADLAALTGALWREHVEPAAE